jgi:hypothetical protein
MLGKASLIVAPMWGWVTRQSVWPNCAATKKAPLCGAFLGGLPAWEATILDA